jgi:hypothetical protein
MDNIFTTAKTQNSKQKTNEYYVYVGNEDFIDENNNLRSETDDNRVLAKKIYRDNGSSKLMIKCDSYNKPFNPDNQMESANRTIASYTQGAKFVTVSDKAFEHYLKFLQTKNNSWLLNTERELI